MVKLGLKPGVSASQFILLLNGLPLVLCQLEAFYNVCKESTSNDKSLSGFITRALVFLGRKT